MWHWHTLSHNSLCSDISHRRKSFQSIKFFLPDKSQKSISVYQWPHKGTIYRSAISVTVLNVLYVCPVYSSNLLLFLFHYYRTAIPLFCFSVSCSFSLRSKILNTDHCVQTVLQHPMVICCYQICLNKNHHIRNIVSCSGFFGRQISYSTKMGLDT